MRTLCTHVLVLLGLRLEKMFLVKLFIFLLFCSLISGLLVCSRQLLFYILSLTNWTVCAALLEVEETDEGLQGVIPMGRGSSTMTRPTTWVISGKIVDQLRYNSWLFISSNIGISIIQFLGIFWRNLVMKLSLWKGIDDLKLW